VSLVWLLPAAIGVGGAIAVIAASRNAVRRAERLRVSLSRIRELRPPVERLGDDLRGLTATLDELRRRP
jgi:hypothetical protein